VDNKKQVAEDFIDNTSGKLKKKKTPCWKITESVINGKEIS
jgi:hypothetical protein